MSNLKLKKICYMHELCRLSLIVDALLLKTMYLNISFQIHFDLSLYIMITRFFLYPEVGSLVYILFIYIYFSLITTFSKNALRFCCVLNFILFLCISINGVYPCPIYEKNRLTAVSCS